MINPGTNIKDIKEINTRTRNQLAKNDLVTVQDLLDYFPRRYEIRPNPCRIDEAAVDSVCAISGMIIDSLRMGKKGQWSARFYDGKSVLYLTWFNAPYVARYIFRNKPYIIYGKVTVFAGRKNMVNPVCHEPDEYLAMAGSLIPIYPQKKGMKTGTVFKTIRFLLENTQFEEDRFDQAFRNSHSIISRRDAYRCVHWPANEKVREMADRRIKFDEIYDFIGKVRSMAHEERRNKKPIRPTGVFETIQASLPYALTSSQVEAYGSIMADLGGDSFSKRLIQGDVGCGKTLIAFAAIYLCIKAGGQAAMMAPTAMNQQKFLISLDGEEPVITAGRGPMVKIDLGIVKYNFEAASGHKCR